MVLAKLFSRSRLKLSVEQVVGLEELDLMLDVETDRFEATSSRLGKEFAKNKALLDLAGHRARRLATSTPAIIAGTPYLRCSPYQRDLRPIPPRERWWLSCTGRPHRV